MRDSREYRLQPTGGNNPVAEVRCVVAVVRGMMPSISQQSSVERLKNPSCSGSETRNVTAFPDSDRPNRS